jgi:hypothetical protein
MRTITPLFIIVSLLGATCSSLLAQEPMPDSVQQTKSFRRTITKQVSAEYLLFLPKDYKARASQKWALILFLHGSGERGTRIWLVAQHGPPKIVKAKPDFPSSLSRHNVPQERFGRAMCCCRCSMKSSRGIKSIPAGFISRA